MPEKPLFLFLYFANITCGGASVHLPNAVVASKGSSAEASLEGARVFADCAGLHSGRKLISLFK
jgi:hypothetical protein